MVGKLGFIDISQCQAVDIRCGKAKWKKIENKWKQLSKDDRTRRILF